jgi:predicted glutamine amidotransferase
MCQLSFVDTNDLKLSRNIIQLLGVANTLKSHNDGYGIFSNYRVFKTKETPVLDNSFFSLVNQYVGRTSIFHVRRASTFGNKKSELRDKDAHPFQEKIKQSIITLAHNGTLNLYSDAIQEFKDIKEQDIIDSHVFLKCLALNMQKNNREIVEGLQSTMESFYGKFAFMINYKKNYYIVRGKRATLFQVKLKLSNNKKAIIVNTEKDSLIMMLNFLRKTITTIYNDETYVKEISTITPLEEETIFIYNPQGMLIEKVGDIKENYAKTTIHTPTKSHSTHGSTFRKFLNRRKESTQKQLPEPQIKEPFDKNTPFMDVIKSTNLSITELSHLFTVLYGISILDADINYMEDFEEKVIKLVNASAFNKRIKTFNNMLGTKTKKGSYITRYGIATNESLEPLYFLNTPREMEKLLKQ